MEFIKLKNNTEHRQIFKALILPYCKELDKNAGRRTPDEALIRFADSIVDMSDDNDRFIVLCQVSEDIVGFVYGKIDRKEHRGYVRPGWGYVMEFYVKPEHRRKGYGKEMYQHLEEWFYSRCVNDIWLTADPVTGEPFWSAVGFVNSGERSPENNLYIYERIIK